MTTAQTIAGHYAQLLGLNHPWTVKEVKIDVNNLKINISVAWEQGNKAPCPLCGKPCNIEDHREERSWRHLDTMQFETTIACRIPRIFKHSSNTLYSSTPSGRDSDKLAVFLLYLLNLQFCGIIPIYL